MAGPWKHLDAPASLPKWMSCDGFSGLLAYSVPPATADDPQPHTRLVMRAVALPELPHPAWAVVFDLPLSSVVEERIADETGIRIGEVTALPFGSRENVLPVAGRSLESVAPDPLGREQTFRSPPSAGSRFSTTRDWASGTQSGATLAMRINAWAIYDRLSAASASVGELNFGQLLLARARPRRRAVPRSSSSWRSSSACCSRARSPARSTTCSPARSTCATATSRIRFPCAPAISSASWPSRST